VWAAKTDGEEARGSAGNARGFCFPKPRRGHASRSASADPSFATSFRWWEGWQSPPKRAGFSRASPPVFRHQEPAQADMRSPQASGPTDALTPSAYGRNQTGTTCRVPKRRSWAVHTACAYYSANAEVVLRPIPRSQLRASLPRGAHAGSARHAFGGPRGGDACEPHPAHHANRRGGPPRTPQRPAPAHETPRSPRHQTSTQRNRRRPLRGLTDLGRVSRLHTPHVPSERPGCAAA